MWGISYKIMLIDDDEIKKISVTIYKDKQLFRKLNLVVGDKYKVEPVKKNKKKHRDRLIQIHSFVEDYGKMRVRVKFLDTARLGFVEIDDLTIL